MTTFELAAITLYGLGAVVGLVAACSAHRFRELRDQKELDESSSRFFNNGVLEASHRASMRDAKLIQELGMALVWPVAAVVFGLYWIAVGLFKIAATPGELVANKKL